MNIDSAPDKKASTLRGITATDPYHVNIQRAADLLTRQGRGDAKYQTQWASGTTAWERAGTPITVTADDVVYVDGLKT